MKLEDGFEIKSGMVAKYRRGVEEAYVMFFDYDGTLRDVLLWQSANSFGYYGFKGSSADIVEIYAPRNKEIPAAFVKDEELAIRGTRVWRGNLLFSDIGLGEKFLLGNRVFTKMNRTADNNAVSENVVRRSIPIDTPVTKV